MLIFVQNRDYLSYIYINTYLSLKLVYPILNNPYETLNTFDRNTFLIFVCLNGLKYENVLLKMLTHWGRVTHICVGNPTIIGSDNGLAPGRCQWNPYRNSYILILEKAFENVIMKTAAILSRPQYVKVAFLTAAQIWAPFTGCGSLKTHSCHDANFIVTGGATHCHIMTIGGATRDGKVGIMTTLCLFSYHYNDVIMTALASQITSLTIVYSTVYSRRRSKKTSKLRVTGLCSGNSPVTGDFPAQRASNAENVSIWWRHHVLVA